ncbi:DgyrCDS5704 [Dimorphilus gyrociliatus]|uniref:DgyrCDS5704 n=1 Tax=Dimorphilus gyrociliatus TaxID=2664684 RepID=A0A7I8VQI6_9ANNE|nr:DgyrCDS5704 [Dimorphilus gyrociliatus]
MTSIRSSVRPKSSKQAWGTILEPEFGLGFQKMTDYEIDQTVSRLNKLPDQKKRIDERKEQKEMNSTEISDMVERLSKIDKDKVTDSRRTQKDSDYKKMGIVHSYAWKGYN